jgi:uncharacterized protein YqfB (UPF0267 family)
MIGQKHITFFTFFTEKIAGHKPTISKRNQRFDSVAAFTTAPASRHLL